MTAEKKIVQISCKACGNTFKMYVPEKGGVVKVACPHCKGTMNINFGTPKVESQEQKTAEQPAPKKPTKDISDMGGANTQKGKLVQVRGFLQKNISHALQIGDNIVGQYDMSMPSNIMIKDQTISRQSVNIRVDYDEGRIDYKLCLLKSKNPVLLNGNPVGVGEERYLKFGDTIVMGTTKLRFEKA